MLAVQQIKLKQQMISSATTTPLNKTNTQQLNHSSSNKIKRYQSQQSIVSHYTDHKIGSQLSIVLDKPKQVYLGTFYLVIRRLNYAFTKLYVYAHQHHQGQKRITSAIYRVIRTANHQLKFYALQKIKKFLINDKIQQLNHTKNILHNIYKVGIKLFISMIRNKKRRHLEYAWKKLSNHQKKQTTLISSKIFRMYKIMMNSSQRQIKNTFTKIRYSRFIQVRKTRVKEIYNIVKDNASKNIAVGFRKLKKHMIKQRETTLANQIIQLQHLINNPNQSEILSFKERQQKLQSNLDQIAKQKQNILDTYKMDLKEVEQKYNQLSQQKNNLILQNQNIKSEISKLQLLNSQQISMNQICRLCYNNMLLYLHQHRDNPISKSQLLQSMQNPLLPLNINVEQIKQENQVMKQLINEYLIIFGPKNLQKIDYQHPYEYLVKENFLLHKILMSILNKLNLTRDDIGNIRQGFYGVTQAVKQLQRCGKR